ncbi:MULTISPECIES: hypothetical protein [Corallococcus]|uniref:hypothetical protein n=1 Tax=Corallococcus TaxID=83461 RepID=UPI0011C38A76|nr:MULTISPECIES: hypothetical protein [Corallococcus]
MANGQGKPTSTSIKEPENFYQFLLRLLKSPKELAFAFFLAFVLFIPAAGVVGATGYDFACLIVTKWDTKECKRKDDHSCGNRDSPVVGDKSALAECIAKGRKYSRPYVIQSLTQIIRIEDRSTGAQGAERISEARIVYSMLPLKDVSESEDVFSEGYQSKGRVFRWWGSESESASNVSSYSVPFHAMNAQPRTVVTGARTIVPVPRGGDSFINGQVTTSLNEDAWTYASELDVICELTMLIEAPGMILKPAIRGAKRWTGAALESKDANNRGPNGSFDGPNGPGNINARWENVLPGEVVGIVYKKEP